MGKGLGMERGLGGTGKGLEDRERVLVGVCLCVIWDICDCCFVFVVVWVVVWTCVRVRVFVCVEVFMRV